mgnify:CR=1 FL=1
MALSESISALSSELDEVLRRSHADLVERLEMPDVGANSDALRQSTATNAQRLVDAQEQYDRLAGELAEPRELMVRCRARFMQLVSLSFETQHFAVLVRASLLQLVELVALLREDEARRGDAAHERGGGSDDAGIEVAVERILLDDDVPSTCDLYTLGGGEDSAQLIAAARLSASPGLQAAAADVLATLEAPRWRDVVVARVTAQGPDTWQVELDVDGRTHRRTVTRSWAPGRRLTCADTTEKTVAVWTAAR